ncbi:MAG: ATP-grasp domain-containing protein [Christensenellales bacterium]|jgi:gamma-F420-2:alpha-L-glutamate ligase|nr:RimK family alpha-L-glutamate ligase [Clostridiales bacterium]
MKTAIVINGYYSSPAYTHQVDRITEELRREGYEPQIFKNNNLLLPKQSFDFDCAIFLDKDINLARIMEQAGVEVFNSSFSIEKCDDKIKTAIYLSRYQDISMPETVIAPLRYSGGDIIDAEFIDSVEKALAYPMIAKTATGSLGCGVRLIENRQALEETERELWSAPHLYQKYIASSKGKSVRAYVVGGKAVAGMLLCSADDFRSNQGEVTAQAFELDENYIEIAQRAANYLDLDFCAVDFLYDSPMIIEVNSNAYFMKLEQSTKTNIASSIVKYILERVKENGINGRDY